MLEIKAIWLAHHNVKEAHAPGPSERFVSKMTGWLENPRKQNLLVRSSHVWKKHLVHVDYNSFQFLGSAVTGLFQCLPHTILVTSRVRTPQIPYSVDSGPPMLDKELSPVQGGSRGGKLHTSTIGS